MRRTNAYRLAVLMVVGMCFAGLATLSAPARVAQAQTGANGAWGEPVNLSTSGSASRPVFASAPNGDLHVLWWDPFDGEKHAYYTGDRWSKPATALPILANRVVDSLTGKVVLTPPRELVLLASDSGWAHAFWLDWLGNLYYSRALGSDGEWSAAVSLAATPAKWDARIDDAGQLHLVFVRAVDTADFPSGLYYRTSNDEGGSWNSPVPVSQSLYFRAVTPANGSVQVAVNTKGTVLIAWDDPRLEQALISRLDRGAGAFTPPASMTVDGAAYVIARRPRLVPLPGGEFLAIWETGGACSLYQQQADTSGQNWSVPVRVFDTLGQCLPKLHAFATSDGRVLMTIDAGTGDDTGAFSAILEVWDGQQWSAPLSPQVSFADTATGRSVSLGCLRAAVHQDRLTVIGCDANGDIWSVTSQLSLADMMPLLAPLWAAPITLSNERGDAGLPAAAVDLDGHSHVLWTEADTTDGVANHMMYAQTNVVWAEPSKILNATEGSMDSASIAVDAGGIVHAVWRGGLTSQVLYSYAFAGDALSPQRWAEPVPLPAPRLYGESPSIVADGAGVLHVIYAVPVNEDRGVYYLSSSDQGKTWTLPKKVFDAVGAGWAAVAQTRLAVDNTARLHAVWVQGALSNTALPLGVYYSQSADGGQMWSKPAEIDGEGAAYPRILVSPSGQMHMVWAKFVGRRVEVWHQWSPDGGQNWATPAQVVGVEDFAPDVGLVADDGGSVYLVGAQNTLQSAAALFYIRWNGDAWAGLEKVPLAYDFDSSLGATAIITGTGNLGVFYRARAVTESGYRHVIGYVERALDSPVAKPLPTFTPQALPATDVPITPLPTFTPVPTPEVGAAKAQSRGPYAWLQVTAIAVAMLTVVALAIRRLMAAPK